MKLLGQYFWHLRVLLAVKLAPHFFVEPLFEKHAISNLLTSVLLSLDELNDDKLDTSKVKKLIEIKQLIANQHTHFLMDAKITQFRLVDQVKGIATWFNRMGHKVEVLFEPQNHQVELRSNSHIFSECIKIFITNALEVSPPNSPVVIKIAEVKNSIEINVIDFGRGMNNWEKTRCQWFGGSSKKTGMGIGVPLAKYLLFHHSKARVSINSDLSSGTRITCKFPKANSLYKRNFLLN